MKENVRNSSVTRLQVEWEKNRGEAGRSRGSRAECESERAINLLCMFPFYLQENLQRISLEGKDLLD